MSLENTNAKCYETPAKLLNIVYQSSSIKVTLLLIGPLFNGIDKHYFRMLSDHTGLKIDKTLYPTMTEIFELKGLCFVYRVVDYIKAKNMKLNGDNFVKIFTQLFRPEETPTNAW